jgi:transposase-like protein
MAPSLFGRHHSLVRAMVPQVSISFVHMAEMALERGLSIDPSCIYCRVQIMGTDRSLYRAVEPTGQTIDFLLTAKRNPSAAKRFFRKALLDPANPQPPVINVAKNRYPAATGELQVEGTLRCRCRLRQH